MLSVPVPQIEIIFELAAGFHHAIGEARVRPDVDRDARRVDALDQLRLFVGAAGGIDLVSPTLRQRACAGVFSKTDG
jgi:hypothetical protein